jgi:hypothetical protein
MLEFMYWDAEMAKPNALAQTEMEELKRDLLDNKEEIAAVAAEWSDTDGDGLEDAT